MSIKHLHTKQIRNGGIDWGVTVFKSTRKQINKGAECRKCWCLFRGFEINVILAI